jgi:hypothetical protein
VLLKPRGGELSRTTDLRDHESAGNSDNDGAVEIDMFFPRRDKFTVVFGKTLVISHSQYSQSH